MSTLYSLFRFFNSPLGVLAIVFIAGNVTMFFFKVLWKYLLAVLFVGVILFVGFLMFSI